MLKSKYFIAVYTNEVKKYCDKEFFTNMKRLAKDNDVYIADNSAGKAYLESLMQLYKNFKNFHFCHIDVETQPTYSLFHRRVTTSVMFLREKFLAANLPYFLIIESDVIPPELLLEKLDAAIKVLDKVDNEWGILGCLYYQDYHLYFLKGLQRTYNVLSGCTVYKRSLIEKFPFRWSDDNMKLFPDSWISWDAKNDYSLYNDHSIHCAHLENPETGKRH